MHRRIAILRYAWGVTPLTDEELVIAFKALSHPTRVQILRWLREPTSFPPQDRPAEEVGVCLKHIQGRANVSQSTASQFMAVLQRANLVTCTRVGQWSHYRRNEDVITALGKQVAVAL